MKLQRAIVTFALFVAGATMTPAIAAEYVSTVGAIEKLIESADPGATVRVPAGRYTGNLRITKPIVLEGAGVVTLDGGGEGTVVELLAPDITFRGFTVTGSGAGIDREPAGIRAETGPVTIEDNRIEDALFGIDLREAPNSVIRQNQIRGKDMELGRRGDGIRLWWSHGCVIEDNIVHSTRDMVFWYSEDLMIRRNRVEDSRYGLHFMYSHHTVLSENVLLRNSVGIYLMYSNEITIEGNTLAQNRGASGYGIGLKDCDGIVVRNNSLLANRVGSYIDNSPSSVDSSGVFEGNLIAFNERGMLMTPNTHDVILTGNGFVENEEQVAVHGRGDLTLNTFTRDGRGNFWSNYAGFDADGDGIGDFPYEAASLFESLIAREPNLRLFVHSPAQQAIEFTARAMPAVRPSPKFADTAPLMTPPTVEIVQIQRSHAGLMTVCAICLVGVAVLVLNVMGRSAVLPGPVAALSSEVLV